MSFRATTIDEEKPELPPPDMAEHRGHVGTRTVTFLLLPAFSMIAFTSAIEPLRAANEIANRPFFEWRLLSTDGAPVHGSNGISIPVAGSLEDAIGCWAIVICGGQGSHLAFNQEIESCLRRLRHEGTKIGAISDGAYLLARAGLMHGSTCVVHWACMEGFAETFPDISLDDAIYHIDGDRFTCSGGTASLDLMLKLIELEIGQDLAIAISERFLHSEIRDPMTRQKSSKSESYKVANRHLGKAIEIMEKNLEETYSLDSISRTVGVSRRNLERQFAMHTKCTPRDYYMKLRLQRARSLLANTSLTVTEVAIASGFVSISHFAKNYKQLFGYTPRQHRRRLAAKLIQRTDSLLKGTQLPVGYVYEGNSTT